MRVRKKPRFERQGSAFIDPLNCGSTVQWIVQYTASGARCADVTLRDCTRSITWSANDYNGDTVKQARNKIGIAIGELQKCLDAVNEMDRLHPRHKARKKKK